MTKQVKLGKVYKYNPTLLDTVDARTNLKKGDLVRVIQLPGAPKPNTMGHAHVEFLDGKFGGLVMTASLEEVDPKELS